MTLFPDSEQPALADDAEAANPEDYSTRGRTTLATHAGNTYVCTNPSLPPITSAGVQMTREEADAVLAEPWSRGIVYEKK